MKSYRIVFMGTPDFALPPLKRILEDGHRVTLVVTQTDKPKNRGMALSPSPVKAFALERGLRVFQPQSLRDAEAQRIIEGENADYIVVAAYGKILPAEVLSAPRLGCINIHASLLPRHRGAAPVNRAVMAGDKVGGVTVMYMDEGLDTGDIALQKETPIPDDMTAGEYGDVLSGLGAQAISEFLASESHARTKQDGALASYAAKIEKAETAVDFSRPGAEVCNKIRGLSPSPCAYAFINGARFKLVRALRGCGAGEPGSVIAADKSGIEIACGEGSVVITRLQPEGRRVMSAAEFLAGHRI